MVERAKVKSGPIGGSYIVSGETGAISRMFELQDGRKVWLERGEIATDEELDTTRLLTRLRTEQKPPPQKE